MLIAALDTSTPAITAGVVRWTVADGAESPAETASTPWTVLAEQVHVDPFKHAELLMPLLTTALAAAGQRLTDLGAIVVGLGPGPFTGLRVGIATASALGDALQIPVVGVPSHAALVPADAGTVLVVTDARRREVYVSVYRDGDCVAGPAPVAPEALPHWLAEHDLEPELIVGPGSALATEQVPVPVGVGTSVVAGLVDAAQGWLIARRPPPPLTPLYLRRPDATMPTGVKAVLP